MRNKQTIDEMMELEDYAHFRAELVELSPKASRSTSSRRS